MYNQIDSNKRRTWLIIFVFTIFILLIGWFFGYYFEYGYGSVVVALIFATIMTAFSYYGGDKVALLTAGAQAITKDENPYLYRLVENLSIASGVPMPKVHVIPSEAINAFACGRDPQHSSIAVTMGAIHKLENEELEGVLAHELSHIKNYDIRLMTIVIVLVGLISILADWFLRSTLMGGKNDNNKNGFLMIIGLVLIILSPIIAKLIQLAISRRREYLADASGSLMTRYPEGLAKALEKIKNDDQVLPNASTATAHLYIANPFSASSNWLAKVFSTHPPIDERIKKLKEMAV